CTMGTEAIRIQPGLSTTLPASRSSQTWPGRRALQTRSASTMSPEDRASETELIRQAQKGSRQAFDTLVRQYDQAVLRLALHLLRTEPEPRDIAQEACLRAYRSPGISRFESSFYTWIYRIATNLCLDLMRRRKTRREDPAIVMDSSGEELDLLGMVSDERAS